MTEPKKRGRRAGESNKTRYINGVAFETREFVNKLIETINALRDLPVPTVQGIVDLWADPYWTSTEGDLDLRRCLHRMHQQGNLIRETRGVYRVSDVLHLRASHDLQLIAERTLRDLGGFASAKTLRRAMGYSAEEAVNANLWHALRLEGSRIRRDFRERYLYNLPAEDLRNLVLAGKWALPYYRGVYLGMASAEPGERPWRALVDLHITAVGSAFQTARLICGLEIEDLIALKPNRVDGESPHVYPDLVKAIDAARYANPARRSVSEYRREIKNKVVVGQRENRNGRLVDEVAEIPIEDHEEKAVFADDLRRAFLRSIESPGADPDPRYLDDSDYRFLPAEFFTAAAAIFKCDPVDLSWGRVGPRADLGWHTRRDSRNHAQPEFEDEDLTEEGDRQET
ncbi:hypothetical protein CcrJ4_gp471 [Caulobacter phage J4]|nr:hypothetical protein CcrJ4_gp471 [Caulobacter phage J4]UTU09780.1 hypothetical protein CcrBL47_gp497 [Caulobacter phage BL47]UTU10335.1 hypothetical protein CcrRB23_gp473 [Caulobacter phage RB23]